MTHRQNPKEVALEVVHDYNFPKVKYEESAMLLITKRDDWHQKAYVIAHEVCAMMVNQLKKHGEM